MNRTTGEPTLLINAVSSALTIVVATGWKGLTTDQATLVIAVLVAVLGAVNAALVRPIAPPAFIALVGASAALLAGFGLDLAQPMVGAVTATVVSVLALLARGQVSPIDTPISS